MRLQRREPHTREELGCSLNFRLLPRATPVEVLCHDFDHTRKCAKCRLGIQEGEATSSGDNIYSRLSVLVSNRVAHFRFYNLKTRRRSESLPKRYTSHTTHMDIGDSIESHAVATT